jgi:uncharacterized protein (DUF1697 family)
LGRQVALLRGVNVGGHRRVPMADLRDLATGLGFGDVATYVASGNLVYATDLGPAAAAAGLAGAIERRFGFPVDVVARTAAQWGRHAKGCPFPAAAAREPGRVLLVLSRDAPSRDGVAALAGWAAAGERVASAAGAVWIHYAGGVGRSKLTPALLDRLLGSPCTARNWTTVVALRALLAKP